MLATRNQQQNGESITLNNSSGVSKAKDVEVQADTDNNKEMTKNGEVNNEVSNQHQQQLAVTTKATTNGQQSSPKLQRRMANNIRPYDNDNTNNYDTRVSFTTSCLNYFFSLRKVVFFLYYRTKYLHRSIYSN